MKKIIAVLFITVCCSANAQMKPYYDNKQGYWGYKDATSGKSIHAGYITAFEFKNDVAVVEEHDRITLINKEGDMQEVFKYAKIVNSTPKKMVFINDSMAGEYTENGDLVNEVRFKEFFRCPNFNNDFYVLKSGDVIGFIDLNKGLVLPMEYETSDFGSSFMLDGDLYFSSDYRFCLKHNGKWGIIDPHANVIMPFEYEYLIRMDTLYGACKNGKCGVINEKGKERIPCMYGSFLGRYQSPSHIARRQDPFIFLEKGKVIFHRADNNKVVGKVPSSEYDWQRPPMMIVSDQNKRFGAVDTVGKILIPIEYEYIGPLSIVWDPSAALWITCKDKKCGVYEIGKGYKIQPIECQQIRSGSVSGKTYFIVTKSNKNGLYDDNLKPLTECIYSYMDFMGDYFSVYKDGKPGKMLPNGEVKWDPIDEN